VSKSNIILEVLEGWRDAYRADGWVEGPAISAWGASLTSEYNVAFLVAMQLLCLGDEKIEVAFEQAIEKVKFLANNTQVNLDQENDGWITVHDSILNKQNR
jgi:hypothetical protein